MRFKILTSSITLRSQGMTHRWTRRRTGKVQRSRDEQNWSANSSPISRKISRKIKLRGKREIYRSKECLSNSARVRRIKTHQSQWTCRWISTRWLPGLGCKRQSFQCWLWDDLESQTFQSKCSRTDNRPGGPWPESHAFYAWNEQKSKLSQSFRTLGKVINDVKVSIA